jgi:hypothetical protein
MLPNFLQLVQSTRAIPIPGRSEEREKRELFAQAFRKTGHNSEQVAYFCMRALEWSAGDVISRHKLLTKSLPSSDPNEVTWIRRPSSRA